MSCAQQKELLLFAYSVTLRQLLILPHSKEDYIDVTHYALNKKLIVRNRVVHCNFACSYFHANKVVFPVRNLLCKFHGQFP